MWAELCYHYISQGESYENILYTKRYSNFVITKISKFKVELRNI